MFNVLFYLRYENLCGD